jgi:hypothetical protein
MVGVPGVIGATLIVDGVVAYLQIPLNTQFGLIEDQDSLSISAWVNTNVEIYGAFALLN